MDSRAHIQPHSLGVVKVPLSIPMKASPGLAGSGENPHVSPGSGGQGLGAWRGEQALMGEEWQAFLSCGSLFSHQGHRPWALPRALSLHLLSPSGLGPHGSWVDLLRRGSDLGQWSPMTASLVIWFSWEPLHSPNSLSLGQGGGGRCHPAHPQYVTRLVPAIQAAHSPVN